MLTPAALLEVWESGGALGAAERSVALLAAAWPDWAWDELAALSLGRRDERLLLLRQALWGHAMAALAGCPKCRERLEIPLDTREFLAAGGVRAEAEIPLQVEGYNVTFRLPTTVDAMAAAEAVDVPAAREILFDRCLLAAERNGALLSPDDLPEDVVAAVAARMSEADPLADIQLGLSCPACGHGWRAAFDIAGYLWMEIEAWAARMLSEVHTLASAYGWHERDILALGAARRQFYLESVGG
jgi:hypothetical protein